MSPPFGSTNRKVATPTSPEPEIHFILIQVEELHSGRWVTVMEFAPVSAQQSERAQDKVTVLSSLGLSARVVTSDE